MANTPQIPSGASRCKIHAVYRARMCPIVFKGNLVYVKAVARDSSPWLEKGFVKPGSRRAYECSVFPSNKLSA